MAALLPIGASQDDGGMITLNGYSSSQGEEAGLYGHGHDTPHHMRYGWASEMPLRAVGPHGYLQGSP